MRYENADEVFRLALIMQGTGEGVSLDEIGQAFGCSRRKAERLRDKVMDLFPQTEEAPTGERVKRWRIPSGTINSLVSFNSEELAVLEAVAQLAGRENMTTQACMLEGIAEKIRALLKPDFRRRVEPDLELLTEAEGLAMRPGPRPQIKSKVVGPLRDAILMSKVVRIRYRARGTGKLSWNRLQPYGFLYGNQHFLVAFSVEMDDWRLFRLSRIIEVRILDEVFERDPDFSLRRFAERSFGVFQEEPFDVIWKFNPDAAEDAREYQFHPTQTMESLPDGSLLVRFRAGGTLEMSWHLYTWGDAVEVLEPGSISPSD
jgi:predicted DNA-binding transcriptional regulator YafY